MSVFDARNPTTLLEGETQSIYTSLGSEPNKLSATTIVDIRIDVDFFSCLEGVNAIWVACTSDLGEVLASTNLGIGFSGYTAGSSLSYASA